MRTLAVDGHMGASGDMLLGALLAAGADRSVLDPVEAHLPIAYRIDRVVKNGIAATRVQVVATDDPNVADHSHHADPHNHSHHDDPHDHSHRDCTHDHSHTGDDHDHAHHLDDHAHHPNDHVHHAEGTGPARTLEEIVEIVDAIELPASVREDTIATFELLAAAESTIHGTDPEATAVHEVGADDAIADVVGTALLLDDLGVERVVVPPIRAGSGDVTMTHGTYPIPAPAVTEIAARADWSLSGGPVEGELLTPTGAALLAHFGTGVDSLPAIGVESVGYGAGAREYDARPNVLRLLIGEAGADSASREAELALRSEPIAVLETSVDDVTPEVLGSLHDSLPQVGARDVSVIPAGRKKSREGHVVQVIAPVESARTVAARLARETGTLGVRVRHVHRWVADRSVETVSISVEGETFDVGVKIASDTDGALFDVSAEYDDALAVASETGVPVREVIRRAERIAEKSIE